jgi:CRP-like cAMP-binding protein
MELNMTLQSYSNKLNPEMLVSIDLFKNIADDDLQKISQQAQFVNKKVNQFFFLQGDGANNIYLLLQGNVKMVQSNSAGQQVVIRIIGPQTLFGALAMGESEIYPVSAQVMENSQAAYWSKTVIMQCVQQIPQLALNAMQIMAGHIHQMQERFQQISTERVEQRLARTLLHLASTSGSPIPEGILIDIPLTRQELAEMTGTTLYTVSRILNQWEDKKFVICSREQVIIRFPHGLVSIANN